MLTGATKAKNTNHTKNKSTRKNDNATLASAERYQQFVRFVELRNIAPRTRVSYLAWMRRLDKSMPSRDITSLSEGEVLDFLVALRHERELKDSTINQAACALRGFYRDHLGHEWMFPAPGRGWMTAGSTLAQALHRSDRHLSDSAVQAAMRATVLSLGWDKRHGRRPVTCHT